MNEEINTANDALVMFGANLPNHTVSQSGRGKWVRIGTTGITTFRDRQSVYRAAAWLLALTQKHELPNENPEELFHPDFGMIVSEVFKQNNLDLSDLIESLLDTED